MPKVADEGRQQQPRQQQLQQGGKELELAVGVQHFGACSSQLVGVSTEHAAASTAADDGR